MSKRKLKPEIAARPTDSDEVPFLGDDPVEEWDRDESHDAPPVGRTDHPPHEPAEQHAYGDRLKGSGNPLFRFEGRYAGNDEPGIHLAINRQKYRYQIQFDESPPAEVLDILRQHRKLDDGSEVRFHFKSPSLGWTMEFNADNRVQVAVVAEKVFSEAADKLAELQGWSKSR